jgi:hypothetical protein
MIIYINTSMNIHIFIRLIKHGILVLAPTRELACQIEEECVKFGRSSNIRSVCAYGGAPKSLQVRKIQGGIEVLIATPGRLNDLLEMRVVDLTQVVFLGNFLPLIVALFGRYLAKNLHFFCVLLNTHFINILLQHISYIPSHEYFFLIDSILYLCRSGWFRRISMEIDFVTHCHVVFFIK